MPAEIPNGHFLYVLIASIIQILRGAKYVTQVQIRTLRMKKRGKLNTRKASVAEEVAHEGAGGAKARNRRYLI